ncbi:MAG: ComF family protein [Acidimicrobiia bacterium]|nr:ComF family protein [Acidimicrobiia bacterium]
MPKPVDREDFPNCEFCPYVQHGPWWVCVPCASESLSSITDPCPICSQEREGDWCRNRLCNGQEGEIFIERIEAITLFVDPLPQIVHRYKYEHKYGWAQIFARLLIGHLETHWDLAEVDLIAANPSGNDRDHTGRVLKSAKVQDFLDWWPFDDTDDPAFEKPGATPQSAGGTIAEKRQAAVQHANALRLLRPDLVGGKQIVVYDDICTTGLQLNAVARQLRQWGAESVSGIVLARQPWGGP